MNPITDKSIIYVNCVFVLNLCVRFKQMPVIMEFLGNVILFAHKLCLTLDDLNQ